MGVFVLNGILYLFSAYPKIEFCIGKNAKLPVLGACSSLIQKLNLFGDNWSLAFFGAVTSVAALFVLFRESMMMEEQNNFEFENKPKAKKPFPTKIVAIVASAITVLAVGATAIVLTLGGNGGANNGNNGDSGETTPPPHIHVFGEWHETKVATCSEDGIQERACECGEKETKTVAKTDAHTETVSVAVEPTCKVVGLTEGKYCSVCSKILVAQNEIPTKAHTYDDRYDEECNVCGFVRDADCTHSSTEILPGRPATCIESGFSDGQKCTKCGEVVIAQTVISAKGHTYDDWIEITPVTCTANGMQKRECFCGYAESNIIVTEGHNYVSVVTHPSVKEDGYTTHTCSKCNDSYKDTYVSSTGSIGLAYTANGNGTTCTITGIGTCTDTEVVIPEKIQGKTVTQIGEKAFADCTGITFINIPNTIKTISARAFYGCTGIAEITIPESVINIGAQIFYKADNLHTVYYNSSYAASNNNFLNVASINKVVFGGKTVPENVLLNCLNVKTVEIEKPVKKIGNSAFMGCTSLTSITIPDSMTTIESYAFRYCCSLESITIPDSVTSLGRQIFEGCTSLENIIIPNFVTSINHYEFYNCTSLESITIPATVTNIERTAFQGCTSLKNLYFLGEVDEWCNINSGLPISHPITFAVNLYINGELVTNVSIPDTVTIIGFEFNGCTSIESITIPDSVTRIADYAFGGCISLKNIQFNGSIEQWDTISKGTSWNASVPATYVQCSDGTVLLK